MAKITKNTSVPTPQTEEKMKTVKWRPIDSAPKDGRTVLLLIPHPELKDKRITGRWDGQEWVAEPMLFDFGCVDVPDPIGWLPLE